MKSDSHRSSTSSHSGHAISIIFPVAFVAVFAEVHLNFGLIFFMREVFGSSESVVGWLAAIVSLCYIIGCFVVRFCINRIAARHLLMISGSFAALLAFGIMMAPSVAWMFALNGLRGFVMSFFWPPMMGWLSMNAEGPELNRVFGRFNLSWSAGAIVAPFCAGWLTQWNVHLPLRAACVLYFANAALLGWAVFATRRPSGTLSHELGPQPDTPIDRSTWLRFPAWIGVFATYFGIGVVVSILPMAAKDVLHFGEGVIGGLLLMRSLAYTGGFVLLGRTTAWHFRSTPLWLALFLAAGAFLVLPGATSMYLIGATLGLFGFCCSVCYTYSLFHGTSGSLDRGRRMAIHEAMLSSGQVLGAAAGGMIYHAWSISHVYWLAAGLLATAGLVSIPLMAMAKVRDANHHASGHAV
jgi:MFS family permease